MAAEDKRPATNVSVKTAQLPLVFEPNVGQAPVDEIFVSHAGLAELEFSRSSFSVVLPQASAPGTLSIVLLGVNQKAQPVASEKQEGESNYLLGNQPSAWRTHIPNYGRITYGNIYPGIDLLFHGTGGRLEHDFVVQPGTDYRQIRMQYDGAKKLTLSDGGDLHVKLASGEAVLHAPRIYQNVNGHKQEIPGGFRVIGRNEVSFRIGKFDPAIPLIIDPVLDWSTYLANLIIYVDAMTLDSANNTYIAGQTFSSAYPVTAGAYQTTCSACTPGQPVVFITKLNSTGTAQIYSTFLGGSDSSNTNQPVAIAVDSSGNAVVTGSTGSSDFPLKNPIGAGIPTAEDGFVTSLSPDGSALNFSSRLGGGSTQSSGDITYPGAVTVDANNDVYVAGMTESSYLPVTQGALNAGTPSYQNGNYVFLTKLQPTGALSYGAILGAAGSASLCCSVAGISVDSSGDAYLAGTVGTDLTTNTCPWPTTTGVYQTSLISPGDDAPFAAEVSADASHFIYSTLATTGELKAVTWTNSFEPILVGWPNYNFPLTKDAFSSVPGTSFISKLSADGTTLEYSSYFSTVALSYGSNMALALDAKGDIWIGGNQQTGGNLPMVYPLQSVPTSDLSPFVSEFDPAVHNLLFSTYFNNVQSGYTIAGLAVDSLNHVHVVGTGPDDLPTTASSYLTAVMPTPPGTNLNYGFGFVFVIDPTIASPGICFSNPSYTPDTPVYVGSSGQASFAITNCGNANLNVTSVQLSGPPVFALTSGNNCAESLAPQASCTVAVTFTPTVTGIASANVIVTSNTMIPTYNIQISGSATAPAPELVVSRGSINFGNEAQGTTSASQSVTLTDSGTATLMISGITASGDFSETNTCGSSVTAGNTCTIAVEFTPTATGARSGSLTITDNASGSPQTVALSGNGVATMAIGTASGSSTSATVPRGETATYNLTLAAGPGFDGTTTLSCGAVPQYATCTITPSSINLVGGTSSNFTVSISTTSSATASLVSPVTTWLAAFGFLGLLTMPLLFLARQRMYRYLHLWSLAAVMLGLGIVGCGGGSTGGGNQSSGSQTTPAGTYTISVNAASSGTTVSQSLTLIVQ